MYTFLMCSHTEFSVLMKNETIHYKKQTRIHVIIRFEQ